MIAAVISSVVNRPTCAYTGHVCARAKLYGRNVMLFLINAAAALSAVTDTAYAAAADPCCFSCVGLVRADTSVFVRINPC